MSKILMNELNSRFTAIVAKYLNKGFVFSTNTMNGCYSHEICHVDLVDKTNRGAIIRVWMVREYGNTFKGEHDTIEISAKRYTDTNSMWYKDGQDLIKPIIAYEISREKGCYTFSLKEANEVRQLQTKRWKSQQGCQNLEWHTPSGRCVDKIIDKDKLPQSVKDSIMNRINAVRGFKKATYNCITNIKLNRVNYRNRLEAVVEWSFNGKSDYIVLRYVLSVATDMSVATY